jgi:F-type H+-transporting ATPase subunit delta
MEEDLLDTIHSDLKSCVNILSGEPEFLKILSSPVVSIKDKLSMLEAVFKGNCHELVFNFICLLAEKGRIGLVKEIQKDFTAQYNLANNTLEAEVVTYIPLSDELRKKVVAKLQTQTGKNVTITETIDKSILGGIVIKYDNTIIDDSVKTKLKELSKQLHEH